MRRCWWLRKTPAGFAAAVERVLADADLRADLRARGLLRAAQFTWERTARQTLEVYAGVLSAAQRRAEGWRGCTSSG